jgi:hypothetical protein
MKVDLKKHHSIFRRAWLSQVGTQTLTLEESRKVWDREFGCVMHADDSNKFVTAEFASEQDYSAFLLRWL